MFVSCQAFCDIPEWIHCLPAPAGIYSLTIRSITPRGDYMGFGSKRTIVGAIGMLALCVVSTATKTAGQAAPPAKPQMAEEVFKNVQVLKGLPVDEFMDTMGMISSALGLNCLDC